MKREEASKNGGGGDSSPSTTSEETELPTGISLTAAAWDIYTDRFSTLTGILAVPLLALAALISIFGIANTVFTGNAIILVGFILTGVTLAILAWSGAALFFAIAHRDTTPTIIAAFRESTRFILPAAWIFILLGVLVFGATLLFIIPGIVFYMWFASAPFVLIVEGERGMNALLKGREYTRGRWWEILWRRVVGMLVIGIPVALLIMLFSGIARSMESGMVFTTMPLGMALGSVIVLFAVPLVLSFEAVLYEAIRQRDISSFAPSWKEKALYAAVGILPIIALFFAQMPVS